MVLTCICWFYWDTLTFHCSSKVRYPFGDRLHRVMHFGTSFSHLWWHCTEICHHCPLVRPNLPETYAKLIISFFLLVQQPPVGHSRGFYITHNDAPQSVGLLWTIDYLVAETSTCQHTTLTTQRHPRPLWNSNTKSQQAIGRRPTLQAARPPGPFLGDYKPHDPCFQQNSF